MFLAKPSNKKQGVIMIQKLKKELYVYKILLKSLPATVFSFYVLSIVIMNLLANKSIALPWWMGFDCGFIISWIGFLAMDIVTKHFGPKAATRMTILALFINLFIALLFFAISNIAGSWGAAIETNGETNSVINTAINRVFAGNWYVLFGSSIAIAISSIVNNFSNWGIGKIFKAKPDSFVAYISRSYISSAIGQFVDNIIFAFVVSFVLFQWSIVQCITSAVLGMLFELICQIIFSPWGFYICKKWKKENVGELYLQQFREV